MKKTFTALFFLLLTSVLLMAADMDSDLTGKNIVTVEVSGNKRTTNRAVIRISRIKIGDTFSAGTIRRVESNLTKSGLFSTNEVRAEALPGNAVKLRIEVDEKWTLLPIPVFFSDGESVMGGIVLIESNLLGTAKQVIGGFMGGTDGVSGFAVYLDPAVLQTSWQFVASGGAGTEEQEVDSPDGSVEYLVSGESLSGSLGVGYRFTDAFQTGGRIRFQEYHVDAVDGVSLETGVYTEQECVLQAGYDGTTPYGSLLRGFQCNLESAYLFETAGFSHKGRAEYLLPAFNKQRLRFLLQGGYGDKPFFLEDSVSGKDGFRTLPFGKAVADDYISLSAGYDIPVLGQEWGALVLTGFYEWGWYESTLAGSHVFQGPGGGFRVYLKKVAVPALGVDLAYNLNSEALVVSIALGMRM